MECSYCKLDIPSDTLYTHCDYCGSRTDVCLTCSARVMLKDMQQHIDWHEVITFHVYARRVCMTWKVVIIFIIYSTEWTAGTGSKESRERTESAAASPKGVVEIMHSLVWSWYIVVSCNVAVQYAGYHLRVMMGWLYKFACHLEISSSVSLLPLIPHRYYIIIHVCCLVP